jgi:hypothetical protein
MSSDAQQSLSRIIQSARELGVEIDEEEAIQWLTQVAALQAASDDVAVDRKSGVFGHRVALLDFDPEDLERLRRVAAIVELPDRPGVETAIALSGSAAQSQVQTFPGDFDYFERVNIRAATREDACCLLGEVIRDKGLAFRRGPGYQLTEVRFGTFRHRVIRGGRTLDAGASISWSPAELETGHFDVLTPEGEPMVIDFAYAAADPGWCKLDWVLVDPGQPRAVKASNMLDATWEKPDGSIEPLDGFIDPYFQEVYLDAEAIPLFTKITDHMNPEALREYVSQLEGEVKKYVYGSHQNYGKAAKRMYNIFRLTGRFEEAAYIRELFDEPAALMYQVGAILDGMLDIGTGESAIDRDTLVEGVDKLIRDVTSATEGTLEVDLIMSLIRLRDHITGRRALSSEWEDILNEMQGHIDEMVNRFFGDRLRAIPQVNAYMESIKD